MRPSLPWMLVAASLSACTGTHRPSRPARSEPGPATPAPAAGLEAALRQVLDGTRHREDVRVETECRTAEGYRSVAVFGTGVGVWEGRRQFRLAEADLERVLRALEQHRFFALQELYGGRRDPPKPERLAITLTCTVGLAIGADSRRVAQVDRGAQSEELRRLADEILTICAGPGASGVTAASLADGLRQVASGTLAAEVLGVSAHHQPDAAEGWLLRLEGRRLTSESIRPTEGYGDAMALLLTTEETAALALLLAETTVWELPGNLPLAGYTDLKVAVLGQGKEVQARAFAGRAPMPQEAARFERITGALRQLHQRAQSEGRRDGS